MHVDGFGRRIRGMPSKLSEAELSKYRSTIYGLSAHVGHVPKMHLGRNKWHMAAGFSESAPAAIPLSPEAVETAQRAYSAGTQACCNSIASPQLRFQHTTSSEHDQGSAKFVASALTQTVPLYLDCWRRSADTPVHTVHKGRYTLGCRCQIYAVWLHVGSARRSCAGNFGSPIYGLVQLSRPETQP